MSTQALKGARRYARALVWLRRDLRLHDHAPLAAALSEAAEVFCVFVFDRDILDGLPAADRRVEFIWESLRELDQDLRARGAALSAVHGRAQEEIPRLASSLGVQAVYAGRDYEPAALARDAVVARELAAQGIALHQRKDQVILETDEVLTREGRPFSVFTPYRRAWLERFNPADMAERVPTVGAGALGAAPGARLPGLEELGFRRTNLADLPLPPGSSGGRRLLDEFLARVDHYKDRRDFPGQKGPSYLSTHLRFGTLSIREVMRAVQGNPGEGARVFLSELIWREFYFMILHHHPRVVEHAFRMQYDRLPFANREDLFQAWCQGLTGYPLVDAAMRQLNQAGYMHNRLRMLAASFLVKDLQVDWRWGERYFAGALNDFDLAANNGGWQWAASTGCDAQPYFRIFNPVTQSQRFDAQGGFIRRYVPELAGLSDRAIHAPWLAPGTVRLGVDYPAPVVDHAVARVAALALYGRSGNLSPDTQTP